MRKEVFDVLDTGYGLDTDTSRNKQKEEIKKYHNKITSLENNISYYKDIEGNFNKLVAIYNESINENKS